MAAVGSGGGGVLGAEAGRFRGVGGRVIERVGRIISGVGWCFSSDEICSFSRYFTSVLD